MTPPRVGVVLVHWGPAIPAERLQDHWNWNGAFYEAARVRVYVVTDEPKPLPRYAVPVYYREPMDPFSLAKTGNRGIRRACDDGCEIIIKTDPDIAWHGATLEACCALGHGRGIAPIYRMADCFDDVQAGVRNMNVWPDSCGTIALHARTWHDLHGYDERMTGYGIEDGDLAQRACKRGIKIDRQFLLYHIAHRQGTPQVGPHRGDQWGRAEKINPRNHGHNEKVLKKNRGADPWFCETWGQKTEE